MGVEVVVEGLSKSFGNQAIWRDVSLTLPAGEVSVLLGPSGTGKSVFLKALVGLIKPERGRILINGVDLCRCSESKLYEIRKLFGVLFQDGALFGSMNLFDNVAFPLREHTRKSEAEIRRIVLEKMEMVGLVGAEKKLPGEISGGMRKRVGLARALVLDPEIILCDEPDSGLDPVRTAYLSQLLIDINAQIDATILIVTHNITVARTVPDNLGMLFCRELVMFGPREVLLTSDKPVVEQFLNGRRIGPIGMSEEKDQATMAAELAHRDAGHSDGSPDEDVRGIVPQLEPTPGLPQRMGVRRRKDRVMSILHTLPAPAQQGILDSLTDEERAHYGLLAGVGAPPLPGAPLLPGVRPSPGGQPLPGGQPVSGAQPVPRPSPRPRPRPGRIAPAAPQPSPGSTARLTDQDVARVPDSEWQPRHGQLGDPLADPGPDQADQPLPHRRDRPRRWPFGRGGRTGREGRSA